MKSSNSTVDSIAKAMGCVLFAVTLERYIVGARGDPGDTTARAIRPGCPVMTAAPGVPLFYVRLYDFETESVLDPDRRPELVVKLSRPGGATSGWPHVMAVLRERRRARRAPRGRRRAERLLGSRCGCRRPRRRGARDAALFAPDGARAALHQAAEQSGVSYEALVVASARRAVGTECVGSDCLRIAAAEGLPPDLRADVGSLTAAQAALVGQELDRLRPGLDWSGSREQATPYASPPYQAAPALH